MFGVYYVLTFIISRFVRDADNLHQELSGSFEMINDDLEQSEATSVFNGSSNYICVDNFILMYTLLRFGFNTFCI